MEIRAQGDALLSHSPARGRSLVQSSELHVSEADDGDGRGVMQEVVARSTSRRSPRPVGTEADGKTAGGGGAAMYQSCSVALSGFSCANGYGSLEHDQTYGGQKRLTSMSREGWAFIYAGLTIILTSTICSWPQAARQTTQNSRSASSSCFIRVESSWASGGTGSPIAWSSRLGSLRSARIL